MIKITIPGEPKGKGRARAVPLMNKKTGKPILKKKTGQPVINEYTPDGTVAYENLVKTCFQNSEQDKITGYDEPLKVKIIAFFNPSKETAKKLEKGFELYPTKKPDCDNIIKIVLDSLNGIAYEDDKQVISCSCKKLYSGNPRVEVEIYKPNHESD